MDVSSLERVPVHRALPASRERKKDGTLRLPPLIGKIHFAVFTPDAARVVGFMVAQPDIAYMVKQPDRFVALDALKVRDGMLLVPDDKSAFDSRAAERLDIDLDACIIWTGMDVVTESGKQLGYCSDAMFAFKTGKVSSFAVSDGAGARALVGHLQLPPSYVRGYRAGCMVVSDEAASLELSGGAAAKAAEMSVVAGEKARETGKKLADATRKGAKALDAHGSVAVEKGARSLGRQLKKSKGMFSAFKSEFKKASGTGSASNPRSSGSGAGGGAGSGKGSGR